MKTNTAIAIGFFSGWVFGGIISTLLLKEKYEKQAQEEVEAIREFYSSRKKPVKGIVRHSTGLSSTFQTSVESQPEEISRIIDMYAGKPEEVIFPPDKPHVIRPEAFGSLGYEQISLSYYEDGVLADDDDEVIDDVDEVVGLDSLTRFGEFEDDAVFVRNDKYHCDYEILRVYQEYSEVAAEKPPQIIL